VLPRRQQSRRRTPRGSARAAIIGAAGRGLHHDRRGKPDPRRQRHVLPVRLTMRRTPAIAAKAGPIRNAMALTRLTGMPTRRAAVGSFAVARMARPMRVSCTNSIRPIILSASGREFPPMPGRRDLRGGGHDAG